MTLQKLETLLKNNQVIVKTEFKEIGTDETGFPIEELSFINAPTSYKLIKIFYSLNVAILENLENEQKNDI